jgi:hypothetical protein
MMNHWEPCENKNNNEREGFMLVFQKNRGTQIMIIVLTMTHII